MSKSYNIAVDAIVADVTANKLKGMADGQMGGSTSDVGDLVAEGVV